MKLITLNNAKKKDGRSDLSRLLVIKERNKRQEDLCGGGEKERNCPQRGGLQLTGGGKLQRGKKKVEISPGAEWKFWKLVHGGKKARPAPHQKLKKRAPEWARGVGREKNQASVCFPRRTFDRLSPESSSGPRPNGPSKERLSKAWKKKKMDIQIVLT